MTNLTALAAAALAAGFTVKKLAPAPQLERLSRRTARLASLPRVANYY